MAKFDCILRTVGHTPIVRINNLTPHADVNFYVKIEAFNPLSGRRSSWECDVVTVSSDAAYRLNHLVPLDHSIE
jgi:cysteine synthase